MLAELIDTTHQYHVIDPTKINDKYTIQIADQYTNIFLQAIESKWNKDTQNLIKLWFPKQQLLTSAIFDIFKQAYEKQIQLPLSLSEENHCISARHLCYWIRIFKSMKKFNDTWCLTHKTPVNFLWLVIPKLLFYTPDMTYNQCVYPHIKNLPSFTISRVMSRVCGNLLYRTDKYNVENYILEGLYEICTYFENDAIVCSKMSTLKCFYHLQKVCGIFMVLYTTLNSTGETRSRYVNELNNILSYIQLNSGIQ